MKNIIIVILAVLLVGALVFIFYQQNHQEVAEKNQKRDLIKLEDKKIIEDDSGDDLIGGEKDEYGCLIGAGYSWCEEKQKCLRDWEEECLESSEAGIAEAVALAHKKDVSEVSVRITQEDGDYARGGVEFAPGGPGNAGMFLAVKSGGEWEIIYDGNGNPDCDKFEDDYSFPYEMLKGFCY